MMLRRADFCILNHRAQTQGVSDIDMSWEAIARAYQAAVLASIPARWRLDVETYRPFKDVTRVPYTSGIMTRDQLQITELTAVEIVARLESRDVKAVTVLEAFAARTAIAHQLASLSKIYMAGRG